MKLQRRVSILTGSLLSAGHFDGSEGCLWVVVDVDVVDDDGQLELLMERSKRGGGVGSYLRHGSR